MGRNEEYLAVEAERSFPDSDIDDLGITVGLIAFTMSSIGVAVPVQAGIGAWHFMVIATLVCFGVNENDAAAFALVVHTVQTAWTVICGLFGIVALPLTNREVTVDK